MALPSVVVFTLKDSSPVRYLSFTGPDSLLRFDTEEGVFSATAKFAVEPAANGLVHLRSSYHNHYWVREMASEPWLSASATKPMDDLSEESCTLFRTYVNSGNWVRFQHVKSGLNVVIRPAEEAFPYYLAVENSSPSEFNFINYESLMKIPRYIMFKGDNDKFLSARIINKHIFIPSPFFFAFSLSPESAANAYNTVVSTMSRGDESVRFQDATPNWTDDPNAQNRGCLQFLEFGAPTDRAVGFETLVTQNGDIRLKPMVYDKFLKLSQTYYKWIWADYPTNSNPTNSDTLFEVVPSKPPNTTTSEGVALRCRGNNLFCNRHTQGGITSCLAAAVDSPDIIYACLLPIDAGKPEKRQVTIKTFRQGRVYNRVSEKVWFKEFDNPANETRQSRANITYTFTKKQTFSCSVTRPSETEASFEGQIPFISSQGQLEIPNEVTRDVKSGWGRTTDLSQKCTVECIINVPAFTKVTRSLWTETATCEVPFSYQQCDEFFFGGTATQFLHDGVFTGVYTHSVQFLR